MANNRNDDELLQLQEQLMKELQSTPATAGTTDASQQQRPLHPAIALGIGGFVIVNVGLLLSLPPVLIGRGAPFLPTYKSKMDQMFAPLKAYYHQRHAAASTAAVNSTTINSNNDGNKSINNNLTFVDLGSGDGRVVFRAAREGLFHKSIGYEINPFLHMIAQSRRLLQAPLYYSRTQFSLTNLWDVDLSQVNVVAVYGLNPIMKDLGVKLQNELQPGSIVLSNVFAIPGWKPSRSMSQNGMHIYLTPGCWGEGSEREGNSAEKSQS
ncbi:hypothetical protein MHU86_16617 [Fragilaria crotonensis]|nr:hypothetical protein MHU86_16617 [Fragilaria crotonensis]